MSLESINGLGEEYSSGERAASHEQPLVKRRAKRMAREKASELCAENGAGTQGNDWL